MSVESSIRSGNYNKAARACRWAAAWLPGDEVRRLAIALESPLAQGGPLAGLPLTAQQHRVLCMGSTPQRRANAWDPEEVMRGVLHSPLGEAARREHRFVAGAVRMFVRADHESRWANSLYAIVVYGATSPAFRRHRRLQRGATLALARAAARAGATDRLSVDVLRRAFHLSREPEAFRAVLEALVRRGDAAEAVELVRRARAALLVGAALRPAARAHVALRDLSARVIRRIYLPALALADEDLGLLISAHLCRRLHVLPPRLQDNCASAVESWLRGRPQHAERFIPRLIFDHAWKVLRRNFTHPSLRVAVERSAARLDLEDFRASLYPKPAIA